PVPLVTKQSIAVRADHTLKSFHPGIFMETFNNGVRTLKRNTYNRVLDCGLELLSKDNKFHSSTFSSTSFDDLYESKRIATGTYFEYSTRNLYIRFKPTYVAENFNAEAGFVPSYG